jgi:hypothetical protein
MAGTNVIPFGKYKGQTVADVAAADPAYLQWLMQQTWFIEKFQALVVNVNHSVAPSEETPAHNAMQARFLDEEYRFAFMWAASRHIAEVEVDAPRFELISDVVFRARIWTPEFDRVSVMVEIKPCLGDDFPAVLRQIKAQQEKLFTLSRLYRAPVSPPYLWTLLVGEYAGSGAGLSQVREMFAADDIYVVLASSVETYLDG